MPRFSILMANYNNGCYIEEAIGSVLSQTFTDWELVIVDDASTDDSLDRLGKYLGDSRIRVHFKERNEGYTKALIYGLTKVSSGIVGILDSDDALVPEAVEKVYGAYSAIPEVGAVLSQTIVCDPDLQPLYVTTSTAEELKSPLILMKGGTHFRTFRMAAYAETGGLDPNVLFAEDWDLLFKLEEATATFRVDAPLYKHRQLNSSQSHSARRYLTSHRSLAASLYRAYRRRLGTSRPNIPPESLLAWLVAGTSYCSDLGARGEAIRFGLRAIRACPRQPASYRALWSALSAGWAGRRGSDSADRRSLPVATKGFQNATGRLEIDRVTVRPGRDSRGHCLFGGDYIILEDGQYQATFDVKINLLSHPADRLLVKLDIYENLKEQRVLAERDFYHADAERGDPCSIRFSAVVGHRVEFRMFWEGQCSLTIRGVVLEYLGTGSAAATT